MAFYPEKRCSLLRTKNPKMMATSHKCILVTFLRQRHMATVPTHCSWGCQQQKQDGRGLTMASVSHPSDWKNDKPQESWAVRVRLHRCPAGLSSVQVPALPFVPLHPVGGCPHALLPLFQLFCCVPFGSAWLGPSEFSSAGLDRLGVTHTSSLPAAFSGAVGSASLSVCTFTAFLFSIISWNPVLEKTGGELVVEAGERPNGPDFSTSPLEREKQNDAHFHKELSFSSENHAPHQWLSGIEWWHRHTHTMASSSLQPGHFPPLKLYRVHYAQISYFPNIYVYIYTLITMHKHSYYFTNQWSSCYLNLTWFCGKTSLQEDLNNLPFLKNICWSISRPW